MLGKIKPDLQQNLFKTRLTELINMEHPLVKLANEISWDKMEAEFEKLFSQGGRPSIAIRKIAGMLLLKEMFKESDESVVERWIENAYWQYFTGETFFQTEQPFDYEKVFKIYLKALTQERNTKDKVYSLHESQVACIAKGKSGKAYEFGTKVAVVRGRKTGIITSVKRFSGNPHDSKTLEESLAQSERVRKSVGGCNDVWI